MIPEVIFFTALSFAISYLILPKLIKQLMKQGFFGNDVHKANKPRVAEPGGIAIVFSFFISIFVYIGLETYLNGSVSTELFAGTLAVLIAAIIGLTDDILNMKWRTRFFIAFLPALPLMVLKAGVSQMDIPLMGFVDFGVFYSLVMIPLMVNFAINEFNMVAGYNGMETGMAIISMITIIVAAFLSGNASVAVMVACMLGGAAALFIFNKYPAKVFIGDTGTFTLGAILIAALIIGNMEKLALGIFFIYFIDFAGFLICLKKGDKSKFARIDSNEVLHPSCGHRTYFFLPYYFPQLKLKEKDITKIFLAAQAVICVISIIVLF